MKNLHLKRALGFSLFVYFFASLIFALVSMIFGMKIDVNPRDIPLIQCVVYWILLIPIVLIFSKWYFRKFQPSFGRGLMLGIVATIVSFLLDFIMIALTTSLGSSIDMFLSIYINWKFYVTTLLLISTTSYAGFEFDRTYTFDERGLKKK